MSRQKVKYNAAEVRISRCVFALMLFVLMAGLVFLQFKFIRMQPLCVLCTAAVVTAFAVIFAVKTLREKKAGADFDHSVWSVRFLFFLFAVAAAVMLWLCATLPVDYWGYSVPVAYMALAVIYVLYAAAWDQNASFRFFGVCCAVAAFFAVVNYQTYYNRMQNLISTRIFTQDTAFTVGWVTLAAVTVLLLWCRYKNMAFCTGVWKEFGVLLLFAAYWVLLKIGVLNGFILTLSLGGALVLWFSLLRVLIGIKVIK